MEFLDYDHSNASSRDASERVISPEPLHRVHGEPRDAALTGTEKFVEIARSRSLAMDIDSPSSRAEEYLAQSEEDTALSVARGHTKLELSKLSPVISRLHLDTTTEIANNPLLEEHDDHDRDPIDLFHGEENAWIRPSDFTAEQTTETSAVPVDQVQDIDVEPSSTAASSSTFIYIDDDTPPPESVKGTENPTMDWTSLQRVDRVSERRLAKATLLAQTPPPMIDLALSDSNDEEWSQKSKGKKAKKQTTVRPASPKKMRRRRSPSFSEMDGRQVQSASPRLSGSDRRLVRSLPGTPSQGKVYVEIVTTKQPPHLKKSSSDAGPSRARGEKRQFSTPSGTEEDNEIAQPSKSPKRARLSDEPEYLREEVSLMFNPSSKRAVNSDDDDYPVARPKKGRTRQISSSKSNTSSGRSSRERSVGVNCHQCRSENWRNRKWDKLTPCIECGKVWCSFCLKKHYGLESHPSPETFICSHCYGECKGSLCRGKAQIPTITRSKPSESPPLPDAPWIEPPSSEVQSNDDAMETDVLLALSEAPAEQGGETLDIDSERPVLERDTGAAQLQNEGGSLDQSATEENYTTGADFETEPKVAISDILEKEENAPAASSTEPHSADRNDEDCNVASELDPSNRETSVALSGKRKGQRADPNSTWCHHCKKSKISDLHCNDCGTVYCTDCLQSQYQLVTDPPPQKFPCPRCQNYCLCAPCQKPPKRARTLPTRGAPRQDIADDDVVETDKGSSSKTVKPPKSGTSKRKGTLRCHHCRNPKDTTIGCIQCSAIFCTRCLEKYYNMGSDPNPVDFTCFRCQGTCKCTVCVRKRRDAEQRESRQITDIAMVEDEPAPKEQMRPKRKSVTSQAALAKRKAYLEVDADDISSDEMPNDRRLTVPSRSLTTAPQSDPPLLPFETSIINGKDNSVLQTKSCQSFSLARPFPCLHCRRRQAGDTCRFEGIRVLRIDPKTGHKKGPPDFVSNLAQSSVEFPSEWNVPLTNVHTGRIKATVAEALLPILRLELTHLRRAKLITRPRETAVRVTCDVCLTSIFAGCWMCTECGRELCSDCYAALGEYHVAPEWREIAKRRPDLLTPEEMVKRNYLHCQMSDPHCQSNFIPVSRFDLDELDTVVKEMEAAIQPPYPIQLSAKEILLLAPQFDMAVIASTSTANVASAHSEPESPMAALPNPPFPQRSSQPVSSIFHPPTDPAQIPHQPFQTFADTDLTEEIFRSKWSNGETMVVTGLLKKFSHDWSPKYFIKTYGTEECEIVDCATQDVEVTKVGAFFQMFGDYSARRKILKLKDWPPQADFKEAFPELFADFHQAVPIPNYTRRDGSMNIAAHFPTNAVAPDIGPKMYNAFESSEVAGGKGSTRLHMDMADAVNIMLYAAPRKDGSPGCAAWDIFRAEDANKIRSFLNRKFDNPLGEDPIHSQMYYLDSALRRELYEQEKVYSWRIYQRPGEAVFIPAGCAHQVCNLADCIKVAVDFVSPENISRCELLTREFRQQNQTKAWKEDVLQLRTMMWYAWLSCQKVEGEAARAIDETSPDLPESSTSKMSLSSILH